MRAVRQTFVCALPMPHGLSRTSTLFPHACKTGHISISWKLGIRLSCCPDDVSVLAAMPGARESKGCCSSAPPCQGPCRREIESILSGLKITDILNPRGFRIPNCDKKGFYKKKQVNAPSPPARHAPPLRITVGFLWKVAELPLRFQRSCASGGCCMKGRWSPAIQAFTLLQANYRSAATLLCFFASY